MQPATIITAAKLHRYSERPTRISAASTWRTTDIGRMMNEAITLAGDIGIMSAGQALAVGDLKELRRRSGLKPRRELRELPTLQDIYLAIVGNHRDLAELRSA